MDPLVEQRRAKLAALRDAGVEPFPHAYPGVVPTSELVEGGPSARIAGRLAARRGGGKAMFLDLVDRAGRMQLRAERERLGDEAYDRLKKQVDLGDFIGVDGTLFTTDTGQPTVQVEAWTLLSKALRPPPEKYHGVSDTEVRYRQREVDLFSNEESRAVFLARSRIVSGIRRFLDDEGFVEVETPVLQPLYGGAAARPFTTHYNALDQTMYLRIATELYLKRLIVGGLERVYEIGKNFRNEGLSRKHLPEFTMLEWYEAYADYKDVAERFERLMHSIAPNDDFAPPWERKTFAGAIAERTGVDILAARDVGSLKEAAREAGFSIPDHENTWAQAVDHLLTAHVEPTLIRPTFLFDYPVELSPFAKKHRSEPGLVERFEAYAGGMEIANAFTELNDPDDQRARFEQQRAFADAGDEEAQPFDEAFLAALEHGMPPTGGIGFGIDRITMLLTGQETIREVVLFPALRS